MTTILIDKKKQFQIQTVQSKLDNYKNTLITLINSRKQLSDNLALTNPNYDKINKLNDDKNILENNLKEFKNNISKNTNDISQLSKTLKELPSIRDSKNKNEEDILIQEIDRIKIQKVEDHSKYDESISNAHIDKLQLIDDINIIQSAIKIQNDVISQIQLNAHSSRKDTLTQLHQKKNEKQNINLQKTQIGEQTEFINIQISELQNIISDLETFKTILVNETYNNTANTDIANTIDNYYTKFNIGKEILLNDKIDIINSKIIYNTNRIQNINIKLNKTIISNDARITNIINNYNKTDRVKVIAYKDSFKIEKEKLKQLQQTLDKLLYQYDSFENNIINNIKLKLTNAINDLDFDITRANERLVIMKFRNNLDFEIENNRITDEIAILNIKIEDMRKSFNNTNKELQNLKTTIENENIIGNDIAKLDEEIKKYKAMILQNETNIILLSQ
jgi:hypothetical protein